MSFTYACFSNRKLGARFDVCSVVFMCIDGFCLYLLRQNCDLKTRCVGTHFIVFSACKVALDWSNFRHCCYSWMRKIVCISLDSFPHNHVFNCNTPRTHSLFDRKQTCENYVGKPEAALTNEKMRRLTTKYSGVHLVRTICFDSYDHRLQEVIFIKTLIRVPPMFKTFTVKSILQLSKSTNQTS